MTLFSRYVNEVACKHCTLHTLFENYSNCRIRIFQFWTFPPIFFTGLLSTPNVNVAHFARNVEYETFSLIFKHCEGRLDVFDERRDL